MGADDPVARGSKPAPHLSEEEVRILRDMTPAQKIAVMHSLIRQAYELKAAGIRARWPDLPEAEIWPETIRSIVGRSSGEAEEAFRAWIRRLDLGDVLEEAHSYSP